MAKDDFLAKVIGNKERAQLLRVFLFNQSEVFTLLALAKRAGLPVPAVKREVKKLEELGVAKSGKPSASRIMKIAIVKVAGKKKPQKEATWYTNPDLKHLRALTSFVHEISPVRYDNIIDVLRKSGKISAVILSGSFMGDATRPADLIVAADPLNERRLDTAIRALEPAFGREIRYAAFSTPEFRYRLTIQDKLIRDTLDFPHLVLLDRTRLL